jgi:acyl carrier protein
MPNAEEQVIMNDRITHLIYKAVDQINEQLEEGKKLEKSVETVLFGKSGKLDSLGVVNLIVATEEIIEDEFAVILTIADERAMSQKKSPFRTIGTLSNYVSSLLKENGIN